MKDQETIQALFRTARQALKRAYAPYSKIHVGAALQGVSGKIFSAANVENASYGLSMCAERLALYQALAQGEKAFQIMAIVSNRETAVFYPCGACLQVLAEFEPSLTLLLKIKRGTFLVHTVKELLSHPFQIP